MLVPPLTPTAAIFVQDVMYKPTLTLVLLTLVIDSLFSCYLAPQLYFIPINHCFLLETLSSLSSNDPHSIHFPFTSACSSFSAGLHMMVHPKVQASDFLFFLFTHSTGALFWTQGFKSRYCDDVFIIISSPDFPLAPHILESYCLCNISTYVSKTQHLIHNMN